MYKIVNLDFQTGDCLEVAYSQTVRGIFYEAKKRLAVSNYPTLPNGYHSLYKALKENKVYNFGQNESERLYISPIEVPCNNIHKKKVGKTRENCRNKKGFKISEVEDQQTFS